MTKYNKSRILFYFIIFISFWKRFEHKRKISYIYFINQIQYVSVTNIAWSTCAYSYSPKKRLRYTNSHVWFIVLFPIYIMFITSSHRILKNTTFFIYLQPTTVPWVPEISIKRAESTKRAEWAKWLSRVTSIASSSRLKPHFHVDVTPLWLTVIFLNTFKKYLDFPNRKHAHLSPCSK